MRWLRILLKEKDGIDPKVRRVTIKISRLPFAIVTDNCEGHFYLDKACQQRISLAELEKRISSGKTPRGIRIYWEPAYFELLGNGSLAAKEFSKAWDAEVPPRLSDSEKPVSIETARQIRQYNLRYISAVERLVDKFAAKYCPQ